MTRRDHINCARCDNEVHELAVFPGGICVDCYAQTPEANAPMTSAGLAQMWRDVAKEDNQQ